jgi:hypothetical protein
MGIKGFSLENLFSIEVKNAWSCTSIYTYAFIAWCLIKHRDNFGMKLICILCSHYSDFKPRRRGRDPVFTAAIFGKVITFANECGII